MLGITKEDDTIHVQNSTLEIDTIKKSASTWPCPSIFCPRCELVFCGFRFTSQEESRYYQDYMTGDYVTHRIEYDGIAWSVNQNYYTTDEYKSLRQNKIAQGVSAVVDTTTINSVLDYGGNTGELIPHELSHAQRYVLEVQDRTLSPGVKRLTNHQLVDLVICAHTLEHVSDPNNLVKDIKQYINPNGYLYIEVPNESRGDGRVGWFHEHINLFSPTALIQLLTTNGFTPCGEVASHTYPGHLIGSVYSIVGQLK
jgi:SAM-dependent methyltransferase